MDTPQYQPPEWLLLHREAVRSIGDYRVVSTDESGANYAEKIDAIASGYFSLYLEDPDLAIERMGDYLGMFQDINRSVGILNKVTTEQRALIVNIASLRYSEGDETKRRQILAAVNEYLTSTNVRNIPAFTAMLRNPDLLMDLVANWDINWPRLFDYREFAETAEWSEIEAAIKDQTNNSLMFSLVMPLDSVAPQKRQLFIALFPDLSARGIEIIGTYLRTCGAHDEMLSADIPTLYGSWSGSINNGLLNYGEEYRAGIIDEVVHGGAGILYLAELSFPGLLEKLAAVRFHVNADSTSVEVLV